MTRILFKVMEGHPSRRDESAWRGLGRFCEGQGIEVLAVDEVLEAFVVGGLAGRAASTKGTYRSALRAIAGTARPARATPFPGSPAKAPYTEAEIAELLAMATSQCSPGRRASALSLLALGVGAGLRAGEIASVVGEDVISEHGRVRLAVAGRVVPVTAEHGKTLARLAKDVGPGYLFCPGPADRHYKNFVNSFCSKVEADPAAPKLSAGRARSSFICAHLATGTPLGELLYIAGIKEVESLLRYARHVPGAPGTKAGLRARLRAR